MLFQSIKTAVWALFFLGIFSIFICSCRHEDTVNPKAVKDSEDITLEEVKGLYNNYLKQQPLAGNKKRKRKEEPVWNMASYITLIDGTKALATVMKEESDALTLLSFDKNARENMAFEELFTSVKLVAYKDSDDKEHLERMYIKGDLDYSKRKKFRYEDFDFSGRIWFEDMNDNFLRAVFYKDGRIIGTQQVNLEKLRNSRVTDYTCNYVYETTTTTTSYYSASINCPDCPPKFMYNSSSSTTTVLWESCYNPNAGNQAGAGTGLNISDTGFWDWYNQLNSLEVN